MAIKINGLFFAETDAEYKKNSRKYRGFVKRYRRKMEFFNKKKDPMAAINKHGVIMEFNIKNGQKDYGFAWKDGVAYSFLGNPGFFDIKPDLRRISKRVLEKTIDTRPNGGMISAFPDDEFWYK